MPWIPSFHPDTFESQFAGAPSLRVEELTPSDYTLIGPGEPFANLGAALGKTDKQYYAFKPGAHIVESRRDILNERIFLVGFDPDNPARLDWNVKSFSQARVDPTHGWRFRSMGNAPREVVVANLILENLPQMEAIGAKVIFYNCHFRNAFYDLFFQQGSKESGVRNPGFRATVNCLIERVHNRIDRSSGSRDDGLYQAGQHAVYDEAENEKATHFLFLNNFVKNLSGMAFGHYKSQITTHTSDGLHHIRVRNNLALNASRGVGFDVANYDAECTHNVLLKLPDFDKGGLENTFPQLWEGPFVHLNSVSDVSLRHNLYASFCNGGPFLWVHTGHTIEFLNKIDLQGNYWGVDNSMSWSWTPGARHGGYTKWLPAGDYFKRFGDEHRIDREAFRHFDLNSDPKAILDLVYELTDNTVMTGQLDPIGPSFEQTELPPPPPPPPPEEGVYYVSGSSHCTTCTGANRNDAPPDFRHYADQETVEIRQGTLVRGDLTSEAETLLIRNGLWDLKDLGATVLEGDIYVSEGVEVTFEGVTHDGVVHQGDEPPPPPPPPPPPTDELQALRDEVQALRDESQVLRDELHRVDGEGQAVRDILAKIKEVML